MTAVKTRLEKLDPCRYLIPKQGRMLTCGLVYAGESMLEKILADRSLEQVANVACLPGIAGYALAMPDIHWGYGFPIGGVAAFSVEEGVISPGGVGYDINCGVRLLATELSRSDLEGKIPALLSALFSAIPAGVGSSRADLKLSRGELKQVLEKGASWAVEKGLGEAFELEFIESRGRLSGARAEEVSEKALERGRDQLGTLGSGNHFVEIQWVEKIFDEKAAQAMGLFPGQIALTLHTGSRGLGHQVCEDYLKVMLKAAGRYGIYLPDTQLCCAPVKSEEGRSYFAAMNAAANFAFANRQIIAHWIREVLLRGLSISPRELGLRPVYDLAHNIAKIEKHRLEGKETELCVHRKGATRAFGPGNREIPEIYREIGQPVLVPGDMGRYSYLLTGTQKAQEETFASCCHGAGREMSRNEAVKKARGRSIAAELEKAGVQVRSAQSHTLAEEMPEAYKDAELVVGAARDSGLANPVARFKPLAVLKG